MLALTTTVLVLCSAAPKELVSERRALHTTISAEPETTARPPTPPAGVLEVVTYRAPLGQNAAYVTPVRKGPRRPAMVWIGGGFDWSIGERAWAPASREDDQSARAFREAGLVLLLPSLRGCNGNPGKREFFLGEVDDVVAAVRFVASRPDVDPARVYLGGHSTGGTLALLAAASGARVAAVYAFGPIDDVSRFGGRFAKISGPELTLRSPIASVGRIEVPTWVIEGKEMGNAAAFEPLKAAAGNAPVHFLLVPAANHVSVLAPSSELLGRRLALRRAEEPPVAPTVTELEAALREPARR
jgi:dipeptidyl aminopeptidase/acylaminoacyl peptidase